MGRNNSVVVVDLSNKIAFDSTMVMITRFVSTRQMSITLEQGAVGQVYLEFEEKLFQERSTKP